MEIRPICPISGQKNRFLIIITRGKRANNWSDSSITSILTITAIGSCVGQYAKLSAVEFNKKWVIQLGEFPGSRHLRHVDFKPVVELGSNELETLLWDLTQAETLSTDSELVTRGS